MSPVEPVVYSDDQRASSPTQGLPSRELRRVMQSCSQRIVEGRGALERAGLTRGHSSGYVARKPL